MATQVMSEIRFCSHVKGDYRAFSNFYTAPIMYNGRRYATNEHLYQASKYTDLSVQEMIRTASSPSKAKLIARFSPVLGELRTKLNEREQSQLEEFRQRGVSVRPDWHNISLNVMLYCLYLKFSQHPGLAQLLISTGNATIIESNSYDKFWAQDQSGVGENWLGRLLMQVRTELQAGRPLTL